MRPPPPSNWRAIVGAVFVASLSSSAFAATCPNTLTDDYCDTDGSDGATLDDICHVFGSTYDCVLDRVSSSTGAEVWAVTDTLNSLFMVFGYDGGEDEFCCTVSTTGVSKVWVHGTEYDDTIDFTYDTYNLEPDGSALLGVCEGAAGEDAIQGSDSTSASYSDMLHGGSGVDTIYGGDGDDIITGDGARDDIWGEGGDDDISGGEGNDNISGGDGDDIIRGNSDDDQIQGGDGADALFGGTGIDVMCGDDDGGSSAPDQLFGGPGTDKLWGPADTCSVGYYNQGSGGTESDECDNCSSPGYLWTGTNACETVLTERPNCEGP